jgi:AmmeMemoRadiSam system protein B/AmmeMemoRadiSam system protein A
MTMAVETTMTAPQALTAERPELTERQQELLLSASAELLCATVTSRKASYTDPTLDGAANYLIAGAFFSLKRGKHLRACCGGLRDQPVPLGEAVADAIVRTALEDVRFPVVSPIELAHLDMEVWLLFRPERVSARGEERVGAVVTGGKHGLIIVRGDQRGLLLPGVAVDHGWDSRQFLEQVCVKAGMHPSLWKDDGTALFTFEGLPLRGRVGDHGAPNGATVPAPALRPEELTTYARFCARNIHAVLTGAVPLYTVPGVGDGTVTGVSVMLRRVGNPNPVQLNHILLRPGVALQATLFQLSQSAAQQVARAGVTLEELNTISMGLTVFSDPAMHGTVAEPHLLGLDAQRRAALVIERGKTGIAFDPRLTAEELVAAAAEQAQVNTPASAVVYSVEVISTDPSVRISSAPRPADGPAVRAAGVAGRFYPGEAVALRRMVDELLGDERGSEDWAAAMIPHAGLQYSGRIAAAVLRRLRIPRTVIVIGPKHTALGMEWAVAPHRTWSLPGMAIASDPELARELAEAVPGLALDALAHQQEHAIEVELPFLARLAPETRVVGIAMGYGDLDGCRRFADGLAAVLRRREDRPLLLISSDMNHFATDEQTRVLDEMALTALEGLDPTTTYETVTQNHISMCGVLPAVIVLETLKQLGTLGKAERVGYATSADVTGDSSRVVGYAGMLFG